MSIAEWEKEASPSTEKVEVCFDRELVSELEAVQVAIKRARRNLLAEPRMLETPPEAVQAIAELEQRAGELSEQVSAKTRVFVFQSIGRRKWRKLKSEHPPSDEQLETIRDQFGNPIDWNPETFPQAAMVECCSDPGLTEEEATWLAEELPEAVFLRFSNAVFKVNILGGDEKKAVDTAAAQASELR